jgi:AraC-like DNA-binding protein
VISRRRASSATHTEERGVIVRELERFLHATRVENVHFAEFSVAPPTFAYVTNFPRLSIPLKGCHKMELAHNGRSEVIRPRRGHAVFVPDNAWNNPDWTTPVQVLTFLFGAKHIGISLVRHDGKAAIPASALKTSIHGEYEGLPHSILSGLMLLATEDTRDPLAGLLTEALLHACLRLLKDPQAQHSRKAARTYESVCLYLQENFQREITRKSVADHFRLAPNHVSRLFRKEGLMNFNDYLNVVRVNRARFMLQTYEMTLKEIAAKCGYRDTAYFCRVFKKMSKATPTQYRSQHSAAKAGHPHKKRSPALR